MRQERALRAQTLGTYCPVCWRPVRRTRWGSIERHWDSIGRDVCPMSNEDYTLAEIGRKSA